MSTYAPAWVKTDHKRFPRAELGAEAGETKLTEVLSLFDGEVHEADSRAFGKLMAHIKQIDQGHSTVIMAQVENEVGLLGDSRDRSDAANVKFAERVPEDLIALLRDGWDDLSADFKKNFQNFNLNGTDGIEEGNWETVFGKGPRTDELFMAYHYARFVNHVAAVGKEVYPLTLYTNVWMNYQGEDADTQDFPIVVGGGGLPGDYPSGGATANVLDIWQAFATNLDFIAPDVYLNDYASSCAKYRHRNQPLFIPEQRRDEYGARRIWTALASYAALGASPFGIDTLEPESNPFKKPLGLLKSVSALVLEAQRQPGSSVGFFFDEPSKDNGGKSESITQRFGAYDIIIERCFVFGKPGTGAGMIIHRHEGVFLLIGVGFQVRAQAWDPDARFTGILRFEEKEVLDQASGTLRTGRRLNGDETRGGLAAMMPNEEPDYGGFPICVTIPARTMIAEVEFYHLKE